MNGLTPARKQLSCIRQFAFSIDRLVRLLGESISMKLRLIIVLLAASLSVAAVQAADEYTVATADQAVPDDVSADVGRQLSPKGFKITSGKRTLCEIWLRRELPVQAGFTPSQTVLYPLEVGELVGAIRFPRKATDFRKQEIAPGVYTLRYGLQPVDGNHVGTSETRDFLLLSPVKDDSSPAKLDAEELFKFSRDASETTHPAIMPMLAAGDADLGSLPTIVHDESRELWSVLLKAPCAAGDQKTEKALQFVVVGHAPE